MVGGNQASLSSRGETVNCCGGKYTEVAPTVWPAPSPTPSDARTPPILLPQLGKSADLRPVRGDE